MSQPIPSSRAVLGRNALARLGRLLLLTCAASLALVISDTQDAQASECSDHVFTSNGHLVQLHPIEPGDTSATAYWNTFEQLSIWLWDEDSQSYVSDIPDRTYWIDWGDGSEHFELPSFECPQNSWRPGLSFPAFKVWPAGAVGHDYSAPGRYTISLIGENSSQRWSVQLGQIDVPAAPPDGDEDGVPDNVDQCPSVAGPPAYGGCPELHIGIDDAGTKGLLSGSVATPDRPCTVELTVQSSAETGLWGEVTTTDGGIDSPIAVDTRTEDGMLAPGGYLPLRWLACFDGPNQFFRVRVDTASPRAELFQFLEIVWAATGTSLTGLTNDLSLLNDLAQALPQSFTGALRGGCSLLGPAAVSCALASSLPFHGEEWEAFFRLAQKKVGGAYAWVELQRALDTLKAADWSAAAGYLHQLWEEGVLDPRLKADLAEARGDLDIAEDRVDLRRDRLRSAKTKVNEAAEKVALHKGRLREIRAEIEKLEKKGARPRKLKRLAAKADRQSDAIDKWSKTLKQARKDRRFRGQALQHARNQKRALQTKVNRLVRLSRSMPVLALFVESQLQMAEKIARARGEAVGNLAFVSCAPDDPRAACAR